MALRLMLQAVGSATHWVVLGLFFVIVVGITDAVIVKVAVDAINTHSFAPIIVLAGLAVLRLALDWSETFVSQGHAKRARLVLAQRVHEHLLASDTHGSPEGSMQMLDDVEMIFDALERALYALVSVMVSIGVLLFILGSSSLWMAVTTTAFLVVVGLTIWQLVARDRSAARQLVVGRKTLRKYGKASMSEQGRRHVWTHGLARFRHAEYEALSKALQRQVVRAGSRIATISALLYFAAHVTLAAVLVFDKLGTVDAIVMAAIVVHIFRARAAIIGSHNSIRELQRVAAELDELSGTLNGELKKLTSEVSPSLEDGTVEWRGVTVKYRVGTVLDNLWLTVPAGAVVGVMAPSGAGKSTLFGAVLRGLGAAQTAGEVLVGGRKLTDEHRRREVASAVSEAHLDEGVKIRDSLLCVMPDEKVDDAVLCWALRFVGLENLVDKLGEIATEWISSTGQLRRFELARCVLKVRSGRIKVLLADEAVANLDHPVRDRIARDTAGLCRQYGITLLAATHDRAVLDAMGIDMLVELQDGKANVVYF